MAAAVGSLPSPGGTQSEFLGPGFSLVESQLLQYLRNELADSYFSFFHIKRKKKTIFCLSHPFPFIFSYSLF